MKTLRARSILAGVLLAGLFTLPSLGPASRGFSRAELGRLREGRLVTRPIVAKNRRVVGGNSWIVVDASPEQVWRALSDPRRYPRMWSAIDGVRVLSRQGNRTMLRVRQHATFAEVEYTVRLDFAPERREVDFRVERIDDGRVRGGWGFFRLEPQGERTLVAYGAAVDPGGGLLRTLFEDRLRRRLLDLPTGVKRYVERQVRAARAGGRDG